MDVIDQIKDTGSDILSSAGEAISNVFEGVKESVDSVLHPIDTLLGNWGNTLSTLSFKIGRAHV